MINFAFLMFGRFLDFDMFYSAFLPCLLSVGVLSIIRMIFSYKGDAE